MMNTAQLIKSSNEIFSDLEEVNSALFKGKLSIEDKIAGIYYLNFNQEISEEYFEELQYKYLAEEFYSQEESLQWNIYLLFINSNVAEELKVKILTDDKYARKLIFTDNEFIDYFKLEKSQQSGFPDIISNWKKELNSVGLQELYSSTSIEGIIRNFMDNSSSVILEKPVKSLEHVPTIEKISSISLKDNYRMFPLERDFKFGQVNLFTGSNGVGKTCLMESIELVLTGKTQRNRSKSENANSITAVYNDKITDTYNHNNGYYKERGAKWYERRLSEQENKTVESFNQFNFFNTDAASLFANSDHKDQINESLKQIILGEEYTLLKDRIGKIENRLRSELNKISKGIEEKNNIFKNNQNRINELKNDKNFEGLKDDIKKNISNLGYKNPINESQYSISNLFINEIKNELDFIKSNDWVADFNSFIKVKENVAKRIQSVSDNKNKFENNNQEAVKLQGTNNRLTSLENKLISFLRYFEVDTISSIETLHTDFSRINIQLSIINNLKDLNSLELDIFQLKKETKNLPDFISGKEDIIEQKKNLLKREELELKKIQDNFSIIEKLSSQIKYLGKEFLAHKIDSDNCPLCEQQISHSQLLLKIESEFNENIDKSILNDKSSQVEELKKAIVLLEKELMNLKTYHSTAINYLKDYENLTFNEIDSNIKKVIEKEIEILEEKSKLENLLLKVSNIGGSVSEYFALKEEISKEYSEKLLFEKVFLNDLVNTLKQNIKANSTTIEKFKEDNDKIISDLNLSLKLKEYVDNFEKIENIVKSNETKIDSINFSFENLKRYLNIPNDKIIVDLSKDLNLLDQNLQTFRLIESSQNEIKKLLAENDKINEDLPPIKEINNRLDKAMKTLSILSSNSEDKMLEDYFNQNLAEIKDIFKTIHSPKEFNNIKYQDKTLILFKDKNEYQISEISTGQRAALVLSIFISLNRKLKNGPNILIFDDPVTFIDDFNALSFLDFLRYFIVKEKKQIFFATANKKFSALFKKKFNFLGDGGFKEFRLER
ncbi:MAG: AAA family ATPase [Flavobacterium circumlabens]|uniref:AAA family ATPase n=1 Tax=Flavobacterium circumlabens TaxID=2133765 RepID=UPI003266563C